MSPSSVHASGAPLNWVVAQSDTSDSNRATAQTVAIMCDHIKRSCADGQVQRAAFDAVGHWGQGNAGPGSVAQAAFWWTKHHLRFVHHQVLLREWLNKANELQLLISPDVLVRMNQPIGDCAIYVMMVCSILRCFEVPYELVTVAVDPNQPNDFTHVFCRAILPNGRRVNLDASHGSRPGWQVPTSRIFKLQVWNSDGSPVADSGAGEGLGQYGLGACGDCLAYDDDPNSNTFNACLSTDTTGCVGPPSLPVNPPTSGGGGGSSSGSSFNWGNEFSSLLNAWTKIGGNVIAPQTTVVRGPNGQVYISTPAGTAASTSALTAASGVSSSWLMIGGAVLAGVVLLSVLKR